MLIKCAECGRDVSDAATACPSCGHPVARVEPKWTPPPRSKESGTKGLVLFGLAGAVIVLLLISMSGSDGKDSGAHSYSAPAETNFYAGDSATFAGGAIVCLTRPSFDRMVELAADKAAGQRYLADVRNGCAIMPAGTRVVIEERGSGRVVRVRRNGAVTSAWTFETALIR